MTASNSPERLGNRCLVDDDITMQALEEICGPLADENLDGWLDETVPEILRETALAIMSAKADSCGLLTALERCEDMSSRIAEVERWTQRTLAATTAVLDADVHRGDCPIRARAVDLQELAHRLIVELEEASATLLGCAALVETALIHVSTVTLESGRIALSLPLGVVSQP